MRRRNSGQLSAISCQLSAFGRALPASSRACGCWSPIRLAHQPAQHMAVPRHVPTRAGPDIPTRASRFAPWQNGFSGAVLTIWPHLGLAATPVSRLFHPRCLPRNHRVLIGAATRRPSEPVLGLTRITPLRGRPTLGYQARTGGYPSLRPLSSRERGSGQHRNPRGIIVVTD
jgi:hypothetical protein